MRANGDPWPLIRRAAWSTCRATMFGAPWALGLGFVQAVWAWMVLRGAAFSARGAASNFSPVSFFRRDESWWSWTKAAWTDSFGDSIHQLGMFVAWTLVILAIAVVWMQALMASAVVDRGFTRRGLPRVFVRAAGRTPALALAWAPALVLLGAPWFVSTWLDRADRHVWSTIVMLTAIPITYVVVPPLLLVPAKVLDSRASFLMWPIDGLTEAWRSTSGERGRAWFVVVVGGGVVIGPLLAVSWMLALASVLVIPFATGVVVAGTALAFGGLAAAGAAVHDDL